MTTPISEADLHAYADGLLPPARAAEVAQWLADHPQQQMLVAEWQRQSLLLRAAFPPQHTPLPARPRWRWSGPPAMTASVLLAFAVGYGTASWQQPPADTATLPASVAALPGYASVAHTVYTPEQRHPVEVGVEQRDHLLTWLSRRLGKPIRVPTLTAQGYRLVGGRLLPGDSGSAAQFMYEHETGQRVTLYLQASPANAPLAAFRQQRRGNNQVFYWQDRDFGYALVAGEQAPALSQLATQVYHQLATP